MSNIQAGTWACSREQQPGWHLGHARGGVSLHLHQPPSPPAYRPVAISHRRTPKLRQVKWAELRPLKADSPQQQASSHFEAFSFSTAAAQPACGRRPHACRQARSPPVQVDAQRAAAAHQDFRGNPASQSGTQAVSCWHLHLLLRGTENVRRTPRPAAHRRMGSGKQHFPMLRCLTRPTCPPLPWSQTGRCASACGSLPPAQGRRSRQQWGLIRLPRLLRTQQAGQGGLRRASAGRCTHVCELGAACCGQQDVGRLDCSQEARQRTRCCSAGSKLVSAAGSRQQTRKCSR